MPLKGRTKKALEPFRPGVTATANRDKAGLSNRIFQASEGWNRSAISLSNLLEICLHQGPAALTITFPEKEISLEIRQEMSRKTVRNFRDHINKGFLEYRKSVTEATGFAVTEWTGKGSVLVDAMDREFLDLLGGFGLYSYGIRHPKIVAAVKAQLDRSPQYSQEMLDPLRAQLAKILALLTPGKIQYGFFR